MSSPFTIFASVVDDGVITEFKIVFVQYFLFATHCSLLQHFDLRIDAARKNALFLFKWPECPCGSFESDDAALIFKCGSDGTGIIFLTLSCKEMYQVLIFGFLCKGLD